MILFLRFQGPPGSKRTSPPFPYSTLFRALLQHDFRYPDALGIRCVRPRRHPPGQCPGMPVIISQDLDGHVEGSGRFRHLRFESSTNMRPLCHDAVDEETSRQKSTTEEARPRGGPARNIADIVPNIGRAAFRRFGFVQSSIVTRWGDIVGHTYAEVSAPESIRFPAGQKAGGTLSLVVASGFAPMMQHVLPEIVERVNRFFGYNAVAKVAMRQGEVESREPAWH